LPAQIDVRTVGYDKNNLSVAKELRQRIAAIPGVVDAHLQQEVDAPAFYVDIDRSRAAQLGLNASTVATNVNVSLSSSEQVSPNFWTDPSSGIPYYLAVQTPERLVNSLNALKNTPVSTSLSAVSGQPVPGRSAMSRLSGATRFPSTRTRPFDVYASVQGRDLGSVSADIHKVTTELGQKLKPGNSIQVVGQIQTAAKLPPRCRRPRRPLRRRNGPMGGYVRLSLETGTPQLGVQVLARDIHVVDFARYLRAAGT
jgi:Cu/Ag efflux pump CusA